MFKDSSGDYVFCVGVAGMKLCIVCCVMLDGKLWHHDMAAKGAGLYDNTNNDELVDGLLTLHAEAPVEVPPEDHAFYVTLSHDVLMMNLGVEYNVSRTGVKPGDIVKNVAGGTDATYIGINDGHVYIWPKDAKAVIRVTSDFDEFKKLFSVVPEYVKPENFEQLLNERIAASPRTAKYPSKAVCVHVT